MIDVRQKYKELLIYFKKDDYLMSLLNECILDDVRHRENLYSKTGRYPDKRDLLHKLISDLEFMKQTDL